MTRFKRRVLIGMGLSVVVLVGMGAWFYYFYFASTYTALQRAEAFLFRRMQVAQLSQQGGYRFFFVTNRRPESHAGPLEERFGIEREEALKFGFFDVKIEPSLGLGMIINPTEWFQNEEIRLKAVQALDQEALVAARTRARSRIPLPSVAGRRARVQGGVSLRPAQDRLPRPRAGHQRAGAAVRLARQPGQYAGRLPAGQTGRRSVRGGAGPHPGADHSGHPA